MSPSITAEKKNAEAVQHSPLADHFIDGRKVASIDGERMPVLDPSDGSMIAQLACGKEADIDSAVRAARAAFEGAWGKLCATERGRLLMKLSAKILDHLEELTKIEAQDTGKPISLARSDVQVLARYFEYYGGATDKVHGQTIPFLNGYAVTVEHEPFGVTGHILPWNYPAQMFGRTLAPALAMGNAVVLKPAEDACLSALRVAELATDAGFPDGAINVVTGRGQEAGAALALHPGIGLITFTGSPEVGQTVQSAAATNYTPCILELGGKSPQIVFEDADLDAATPVICKAILQNAGQTCSAGSRLLAHETIYHALTKRLADAFSKFQAGSPQMDLDCGPMISAKQKSRVLQFVRQAQEDGIEILAQGRIAGGVSPDGFFVPPMLFGRVPENHSLACREVFGPILSAMPFRDESEAVRLANGTEYGLLAGIWTRDGGRQQRMAKKVRAGQVYINSYGAGGGVELPFGGVGKSGHGREKGFAALYEFAYTKTVINRHG